MTLNAHGDRKYRTRTSKLVGAAAFPELRVEHRFLEPGLQEPGTCESTEVALILSGSSLAVQSAHGRTRRQFIQPGTACICPVGTYESHSEITSPVECLHLFLPPTLIARSALADYDIDPAKIELAYTGALRDSLLRQIALALLDVVGRAAEAIDHLFLDGMQAALAAHLLGTYSIQRWRPPNGTPGLDHRKLKRVLEFIEAHFREDISLRDLAAEACLSEFHFCRLFRRVTGLSPHRYVTDRRVQEAQRKLALARSSLTEVAAEAGFGSQATFLRTFRKATGLTPGQYRALQRS